MPEIYPSLPEKKSTQPFLQDVGTNFRNHNDRQVKVIQEIEEKLNQIMNKKTPEKPLAVEKPQPTDAIQAFNEEIRRLGNQNDHLDKILSHLNEII